MKIRGQMKEHKWGKERQSKKAHSWGGEGQEGKFFVNMLQVCSTLGMVQILAWKFKGSPYTTSPPFSP